MEDEEYFISPLDFASLSSAARQADVDVQKQIKNYRDMIEAGTKRMRDQRIGPSSTERLLALAQAIGSPTTTGKFGERMGLIAGTLGGQESARREAELARADMLEKLGLKGAEFELGAAQTRANTLSTLMARQMAAGKRKTGFNPVTGELVYTDTGELVKSAAAPPADAIAFLRANPATAAEFNAKYANLGPNIAARYLGGK
ncbi:MAG: hypothetical protein QE509_07905 [Gammaproteobacteria bacterium]|nr:hypothetical protein [Gammaproteobacteria bacterium]